MAKSKYHSKKTTLNGITYDSKKECKRHAELRLLESAGVIRDLKRQVRYTLIPAQYESYERYGKNGQQLKPGRKCVERAVYYVADFTYIDENGDLIVEDVKSPATKTELYIVKRKLMRMVHGIKIKEV